VSRYARPDDGVYLDRPTEDFSGATRLGHVVVVDVVIDNLGSTVVAKPAEMSQEEWLRVPTDDGSYCFDADEFELGYAIGRHREAERRAQEQSEEEDSWGRE
jgi:hypothetical protein